jgi:TRAP transporter 4TM/12TM fusion protein
VTSVLAFALGAYALYWVVGIVAPQTYRLTFLLLALVLTFLAYPAGTGRHAGGGDAPAADDGRAAAPPSALARGRSRSWQLFDGALIALAVISLGWALAGGDSFIFRAATPGPLDRILGLALTIAVLEATRRTVGWVLPVTAIAFLVYAYAGPVLDRIGLALVAHRGYSLDRVVGLLYMTLEGIFGVPLDVAATYIVLFTIFGAVLDHSGAGRFFVDWALAAIGRSGAASAPGRTVTLAGYLLGAVSGSGVANTVVLGSVSWPMMRRAGYPADEAGAILAAAGIGAILAPPVMGAAAFLIAEFLRISYLEVIRMAAIPALLYYASIVVTIEAESRRLRLRPVDVAAASLAAVTRSGWYYFLPLATILVFLVRGSTAFNAVFWATVVAIAVSFFSRTHALRPARLAAAIAHGGRQVVPVVATTATAGIIVGILTLTGLGLKAAGLIVALAGDNLPLTVIYSGLAVWLLGLAVPVTASYIIAAVMVAPALVEAGVPPAASHMFIFYYAVLSEVSPPTALSPFAAAAVTGGNPFRTTMLSWKYTLPAFVVPLVFTLRPRGMALLLQGGALDAAIITMTAMAGLVAVALGAGGYLWRPAGPLERVVAIAAGLLLLALA